VNLFGVYEIKPFWSDHYLSDQYLGMRLLIGAWGYTTGLWWVLITLISRMITNFLQDFDVAISPVLGIVQSGILNLLLAIVMGAGITYLQLRTNEVFEGFDLNENYREMRVEIEESLTRIGPQFKFIITIQYLNGLLTGILFALLYFLPFFILVFLMIFILGTILPVSGILVFLAFLASWILVYLYGIRRRIKFVIPEESRRTPEVYPLKKRDYEILQSEDPPIVCEYCRSFIKADSSTCPVCDHPITQDS
jgi:hypothetical protein